MNLWRAIVLSVFFCILPLASLAAECKDTKEGSTEWAGCLALNNEFQCADKSLNAAYEKLLNAMNKASWLEGKKRLIASQHAWDNYRDRECEFTKELVGGAGGGPEMECRTQMTNERKLIIERTLDQFKK